MANLFDKEFYPTPASVVSRMVEPYKANFHNLQILEPSAGTGAILDYITGDQSKYSPCHTDKAHVWALEKNEECAMILQGKGYRMLGNDFLAYKPLHCFNLIVMNPPFSNGDEHLLHAWDIMHTGDIVCLLNADTIKNPYTQRRKLLAKIIEQNGSVEMLGNCFSTAQHRTNVDVAMVRLHKEVEDERWHIDFGDNAKMEKMPNFAESINTGSELALNDKLGSYLHAWKQAQVAAQEFIKARKKLEFYVTAFCSVEEVGKLVDEQCQKLHGKEGDMQAAYNAFLDRAKGKAWREIICNLGMDKYMTANLRKTFDKFCEAQGAYELNRENIYKLVQFVCLNSQSILKKAVVDVYDTFVRYHKDNQVYTEGWKTNDRFKVNRKVILPSFVDSDWDEYFRANWNLHDEYRDIDKVMCFLSGLPYENLNKLSEAGVKHKQEYPYGFDNKAVAEDFENLSLSKAISFVKVGDSSLHECAFFQFRCYKKGTLHLIFKDEALWARFNLAVNEGKMELGFSDK